MLCSSSVWKMSAKKLGHEGFKRLFKYYIVIGIILGISVLTYEYGPPTEVYRTEDFNWKNTPPQYNYTKWNVYLDGHSHSIGSDGALTPEQTILWHIAQGFNAMVISDHDSFAKCEETRELARTKYNDSIKVFIGIEWGHGIHLNLIFPPNSTDYTQIRGTTLNPTQDEIRAIITQVHNLGGIVSVNHYFESYESPACPSREVLKDMGVDNFEVVNSHVFDNITAEFCQANDVGMISGTDMHNPETTYGWNALNVSFFTEDAIFNALKAHQLDILYDPTGVPSNITTKPNPPYVIVSPLAKLGEWMESYYTGYLQLDWWGIIVLLVYLYAGFMLYYLGGIVNTKFWQKIHARRKNQPS
jgi:predicted metal-dependent phosphoesterase TrpH